MSSARDDDTGGGIVLFDGTCGFCEASVRFIATRDSTGYFRFAPSQWPQAQAALAARGLTRHAARSLVLIEGGEVYLRSTASLRIAARLDPPWRWARVLLWVPAPIRDAAYRFVAAVRHRLARPSDACTLPPPELRARLLGTVPVSQGQSPRHRDSPHVTGTVPNDTGGGAAGSNRGDDHSSASGRRPAP